MNMNARGVQLSEDGSRWFGMNRRLPVILGYGFVGLAVCLVFADLGRLLLGS